MPTFTVTLAGPERHDGEEPYDYVVDQPNQQLASEFVERYHRQEAETTDTVILGVKEGVHASGHFNDLRKKISDGDNK